jgi:hypothetical protein
MICILIRVTPGGAHSEHEADEKCAQKFFVAKPEGRRAIWKAQE